MTSITDSLSLEDFHEVFRAIPDGPSKEPLRFYAAGPRMERIARQILNPSIEIVRLDKLEVTAQ